MREKINSMIKSIFGTQDDIPLKSSLSFFITGLLFFSFALMFQNNDNQQPTLVFTYISAIVLALWLITIGDRNTIDEIIKEFCRLVVFFIIFILSITFCIILCTHYKGEGLIIGSILSCVGILCCMFYFVSKFIDILKFFKKLIVKFKERLFDSNNNANQDNITKVKSLIENITAFLAAVAALGVAIKTIIEPIVHLIPFS